MCVGCIDACACAPCVCAWEGALCRLISFALSFSHHRRRTRRRHPPMFCFSFPPRSPELNGQHPSPVLHRAFLRQKPQYGSPSWAPQSRASKSAKQQVGRRERTYWRRRQVYMYSAVCSYVVHGLGRDGWAVPPHAAATLLGRHPQSAAAGAMAIQTSWLGHRPQGTPGWTKMDACLLI